MTINDPKLYLQGVWDWGFLDLCFGQTKIKITDIDGMVERNGFFLMFETKKAGVNIPQGQKIMFRNFSNNGNHVLVIWGYQSDSIHDLLWIYPTGEKYYYDKSKDFIQKIVKKWYSHADANSKKIDGQNAKHV